MFERPLTRQCNTGAYLGFSAGDGVKNIYIYLLINKSLKIGGGGGAAPTPPPEYALGVIKIQLDNLGIPKMGSPRGNTPNKIKTK